jgi:hypothetical protein
VLHKRLPLIVIAGPRAPRSRRGPEVFALDDRLAGPGSAVRAAVVCRFFPAAVPAHRPGERLLISVGNGGDVQGGSAGRRLTCPAEWARDLRDLAAAAFADRPGRVALNARVPGASVRSGRVPAGVPWVSLAFRSDLVLSRPARTAAARRRDLQARLAAVLTLWCRIEGWV